ncbi:MAG: tetratricopeptide repeat protein [Pyrinomonadaceae bacterium]
MKMCSIFFRWIALAFVVAAATTLVIGQYKGTPATKDGLVKALKSHQFQTRDFVTLIQSNGVDFVVTPPIEQELVAAGARPQMIAAAKANYRAPVAATRQGTNNSPRTGNQGATPGKTSKNGTPLSKDALITLLQNGVSDAQVRANVESRGVNFKATAKDKTDVRAAGGSVALANLMEKSYLNPNESAAGANDVVSGGSNKYNSLIDLAIQQYDIQKNSAAAIETLKQAMALDPAQPRAYQQAGFAYLYGQKNFDLAENYMRQALDHGGSAVFRVTHDHGMVGNSCEGSLFISKDTVRYESDDNKHTFETADENIKRVKLDKGLLSTFSTALKAKGGAFRFELRTGENDSKNYVFTPKTNDDQESKMIIRLIGKDSK